jgi:hypothetical protein
MALTVARTLWKVVGMQYSLLDKWCYTKHCCFTPNTATVHMTVCRTDGATPNTAAVSLTVGRSFLMSLQDRLCYTKYCYCTYNSLRTDNAAPNTAAAVCLQLLHSFKFHITVNAYAFHVTLLYTDTFHVTLH